MTDVQIFSNPFALMMDPESVFAAVARSERLDRLQRRVCRPLDKPVTLPAEDAEAAAFDELLDAAAESAA